MPPSFNDATQPIWSQQLATAVDSDSSALIPPLLLMESAGREVAQHALQRGAAQGHIVVLVGSGNNGGDALVAARLLCAYQPEVVLLTAEPSSELAAQQLRIYTDVTQTSTAALLYRRDRLAGYADQQVFIIDGLAGLGWQGEARGKVQEIITAVNAMPARRVLAIDMPSGLAADGSTSMGDAIKADWTITFGGRKAAHVLSASRAYCGEVQVANIGFPYHCVQAALAQHQPVLHWVDAQALVTESPFATLPRTAHKYDRGHVLIIGGSRGKCGAPLMSGLAALRAGAGLVSVALAQQEGQQLSGLPLELVYEYFFSEGKVDTAVLAEYVKSRRVQVIVIGPGTVSAVIDEQLWQFLQEYSDKGGFVIIDAAAVCGVTERRAERGILLTPHPGEWQRYVKTPQPHTLELCRAAKQHALRQGMHIVYKSACPMLFTPQADEPSYVCDCGDNSLAKAGSGDVLCGMIAAYLLTSRAIAPAFFTAYAHLAARAKPHGHALLPSDLF